MEEKTRVLLSENLQDAWVAYSSLSSVQEELRYLTPYNKRKLNQYFLQLLDMEDRLIKLAARLSPLGYRDKVPLHERARLDLVFPSRVYHLLNSVLLRLKDIEDFVESKKKTSLKLEQEQEVKEVLEEASPGQLLAFFRTEKHPLPKEKVLTKGERDEQERQRFYRVTSRRGTLRD